MKRLSTASLSRALRVINHNELLGDNNAHRAPPNLAPIDDCGSGTVRFRTGYSLRGERFMQATRCYPLNYDRTWPPVHRAG